MSERDTERERQRQRQRQTETERDRERENRNTNVYELGHLPVSTGEGGGGGAGDRCECVTNTYTLIDIHVHFTQRNYLTIYRCLLYESKYRNTQTESSKHSGYDGQHDFYTHREPGLNPLISHSELLYVLCLQVGR